MVAPLLSLLTACAPMHMALPPALEGGAVLPVGGRGDLRAGYTIGAYQVSPKPRGFATQERSDYLISTPASRTEPFTLVVVSPDGGAMEVACELAAQMQTGFEDVRRYAGGQVECTGEGVVLSWHRASDKTVVGTVSVGGESFAFAPAEDASGPARPLNAGAVLRRGEAAVAAVERLSPGRVTVAPGAGSNAERAAVILLAVVISTEDTVARWARDDRSEEGPEPHRGFILR